MEIKNIKKLKSGKYKIELDNKEKVITYDNIILNKNLLFNKKIDDKTLNEIYVENDYYDIYNKVLKYISTKIRSKKEIEEYLKKFNIETSDFNKIIKDLENIKLIDDMAFAKAFISDKIYLSNNGKLKIKRELLEHNIDEALIDEIISSYNDEIFKEKLSKLMNKKIKTTKYTGNVLKQKFIYEFGNLGYESEMIVDVFNDMHINSNIENEADKIYKILVKKYEGKNLINKLKNKLYSKGYSLDEINNIIDKYI